MKKIKLQKKLSLNKEAIVRLNDNQMDAIRGGGGGTAACKGVSRSCFPWLQKKSWFDCALHTRCGC